MSLVFERPGGTITVPSATLVGIAVAAAEGVDGVRVLRRRTVDLDAAVVRLRLAVRRGKPLLELGSAAQDAVVAALAEMCGLEAKVEITVGAIE